MGAERHTPAASPREGDPVPLYRMLGGAQGRSERVQKISPAPGFDPRTLQSVASLYTGWAIPDPVYYIGDKINSMSFVRDMTDGEEQHAP